MMIDMHTHYIPPELVADARAGRALDGLAVESRDGMEWLVHPQGSRYPLVPEFFDAGAKLEQMDALGLDASVLSLAPTLLCYGLEAAAARDFCRLANESLARLVARADRLYGLATVPLQDPGAAEAELRYAVRALGLRGVEIGTTMEDVPLDDRRFDSFFAAAAELGVPVMLHPYSVGTRPPLADFHMADLTGHPMDTCIAATRLMLSGFLDRHPALKLVLVHAGGFLRIRSAGSITGFASAPRRAPRVRRRRRRTCGGSGTTRSPTRGNRSSSWSSWSAPTGSWWGPTCRSTWPTCASAPICRPGPTRSRR